MSLRVWLKVGFVVASVMLVMSARAQPRERIVIDGSTGVRPLAAALAKAFQQRYPAVDIELGKGLGTKARLQALTDGKIDVALASHGLNVAQVEREGMAVHEIARIAVVFGVNASVPVANITAQQVCEIYSGGISNWKGIGAADLELAARTRPDSEVDAEVVRANIGCLKDLRMPEGVKVMPGAGEMAKELAATRGAIGMTTMTVVEQSGGAIKALSLDGIAPSADNVGRKTYPLVRESFFVTRKSAPPAVERFIAFALSPEGAQVIRANGALPVR